MSEPYKIHQHNQSNLQVPLYLSIKDGVVLRFAQLAQEGQPQQNAVCLGEQDGRSSALRTPCGCVFCLSEQ